MSHAAFTQALHQEMRPLVESMFGELRANPGTSHYHRLGNDELLRRGQDVYKHLIDWLVERDITRVQQAGTGLGQRRFAEGIPLGQVVLAVLLEEKHLWRYPAVAKFAADAELVRATAEFFQEFIYWTARGFAAELDSGKTPPGRVIPPPVAQMPRRHGTQQDSDELISRAGQIGEFGG
jgi:hypothetical protein